MTTGQAQGLSGVDADAHIGPAELTRHRPLAGHLAGQPLAPAMPRVEAPEPVTQSTVPASAPVVLNTWLVPCLT